MKTPTPDFPPLTTRTKELLEKIKALKEKQKTLPPSDPGTLLQVLEFSKIQEEINEVSVKALRSGVLRGRPAESRRPGFSLVFDSTGENAEIRPNFGDFHPDLEPWALKHFIEWRRKLPFQRYDARDILRETGIISIEVGIKSPRDFEDIKRWELIKRKVLELRGVEEENLEMLKKARTEKKKKRTRKNSATWNMVIDELVKEGLLPQKITPQAFKKSLKKHFPDIPWDEI